jgi:hypothetical protein
LPDDPHKSQKLEQFPGVYVPYAVSFTEDFNVACNFFDALHAGVKELNPNDIPATDRSAWDSAAQYLATRR